MSSSSKGSGLFRFKEFHIEQNRAAMKVGTDGVLLGAWASIDHNPQTILDIGAGTGLIALMLAQRSEALQIDAVEIEPSAFETCTRNFEASPWCDRLFCYHAEASEFAEEFGPDYDLIVSNPPFHLERVVSPHAGRDLARRQDFLPFEKLIYAVAQLLAPNGRFEVIIPFQGEEDFLNKANRFGLFPCRITRIKGNASSPVKRSLISLQREAQNLQSDELILEKDRNVYTEAYIALTREFYLKM
ncbi:MAG: hypothetical protein RLZZ241_1763 [Bacteroidota bacterium]|jgi:tRNA1Val (adenine37-N6)-methyltransferase